MKLPHRRQFLHLAAGAAALPTVSRFAWAQAYPSRPVRIVVGFAAGGGADIFARLMANGCRNGSASHSSSRIGRAAAAISPPKLSCARRRTAIRFSWYQSKRDQRDALRQAQFQFHPRHRAVASIVRVPNVMVVNPSFPAKTVPEFIAYAKANPGKINMASAGNGSGHISTANCSR